MTQRPWSGLTCAALSEIGKVGRASDLAPADARMFNTWMAPKNCRRINEGPNSPTLLIDHSKNIL